jgi:ribosomal protein L11
MNKNKNNILLKKLTIYLPAQNPSSLLNVNATLGQNSINSFEFFKQFNNLSKVYIDDIVIILDVMLYIDKKYDIVLKGPSVNSMFYEEFYHEKLNKGFNIDLIYNETMSLNLSTLYKIAVFIKELRKDNQEFKSIFKSLIGTLKSTSIEIINDLNAIESFK